MTAHIGHNGDGEDDEFLDDGAERAKNWFAVSRDIFEHHIVGIHGRSYTEMEAWLSLLAMASYTTQKRMNKGQIIVLDPGDLMASHSFLAQRWMWTVDKVRWFLKRLVLEAMITRSTAGMGTNRNTNQIQVLSIANYSLYQFYGERKHQARHQAEPQASTNQAPSQHQESNKDTSKQDTPLPPSEAGEVDRKAINRAAARKAFEQWQDVARRCGLTVPRDTSFDTWGQKIAARMYEHAESPKGIDEMLAVWSIALANVERSSFLRGMTGHGFKADLKFLCQRESFTKLIDGGYGNGAHAKAADSGESQKPHVADLYAGLEESDLWGRLP